MDNGCVSPGAVPRGDFKILIANLMPRLPERKKLSRIIYGTHADIYIESLLRPIFAGIYIYVCNNFQFNLLDITTGYVSFVELKAGPDRH